MSSKSKRHSDPPDGWEEVRVAEREQNAAHIRVHEARATKLAAKASLLRVSRCAPNPTQEQVDGWVADEAKNEAAYVQTKVDLLLAKAEEQRAMAKHDIARNNYYVENRSRRHLRRPKRRTKKSSTSAKKKPAATKITRGNAKLVRV